MRVNGRIGDIDFVAPTVKCETVAVNSVLYRLTLDFI